MKGVMKRKFDGVTEVAKEVGVHPMTVKRWILRVEDELLRKGVLEKEDKLFYVHYKILDKKKFLEVLRRLVNEVKGK